MDKMTAVCLLHFLLPIRLVLFLSKLCHRLVKPQLWPRQERPDPHTDVPFELALAEGRYHGVSCAAGNVSCLAKDGLCMTHTVFCAYAGEALSGGWSY